MDKRQALKEVENIKKYHMEMMRVLSQTVAQVERIDKLDWKDRVKQYAIPVSYTHLDVYKRQMQYKRG